MLRAPLQKFLRCPAILTCVAALAACATTPVVAGARCLVCGPKASFYKYGPAQSNGPDFSLAQGTKVTLLERSLGFSRVMTDDGIGGYVASNQLQPAPPEPPVRARTSSSNSWSSLFSAAPKRSRVQPVRGAPLFDMSDAPLPLPENPEPPKPSPQFRF